MQTIPNPSSEAELLEIRNQGKISEREYNDLLAAMRKPPPQSKEGAAAGTGKTKLKRELGKVAFVLMLSGIVLPFLVNNTLPGIALQIVAFALSVISWPDIYGKVSIISALVAVLLLLLTT